jgi:hypothetical protein
MEPTLHETTSQDIKWTTSRTYFKLKWSKTKQLSAANSLQQMLPSKIQHKGSKRNQRNL